MSGMLAINNEVSKRSGSRSVPFTQWVYGKRKDGLIRLLKRTTGLPAVGDRERVREREGAKRRHERKEGIGSLGKKSTLITPRDDAFPHPKPLQA